MELLERVVELSLAGYCCSQVMALLLLELLGEEDDGFVRAMGGLINGGGYSGTDCGEILGGDQRRKMERCPEIMALSFEKCIEILSGKGLI